ncbi:MULTISPECIES: DoxX family protein [unclassified Corynebacterium]|uniref:DoxX family protein n=1 Tax=unclassified Corynebacterium TaxID=2624378 RepID=UPI003094E201
MIRKFARPMLASVFVADGVDTLVNKQDHLDGARAVLDRVRTLTPNQYRSYVPNSPEMTVQAVAGTKVVAGSLYALGKAPRFAATALALAQIPTAVARHAFWETQDPEQKKARRTGFITDVGLLGALFLAGADTAGKPGLKWRAEHAGKQVNKKVQAALPTKSEAEKRTEELNESLTSAAGTAKEKVGVLQQKASEVYEKAAGYVDENKDDWTDQIRTLADEASTRATKLGTEASTRASQFSSVAAERADKASKQVKSNLGK